MLEIPGYTLVEKIHKNHRILIRRAIRNVDGAHVIIKNLTAEFPTRKEITSFQREFEILQAIHVEGVARVVDPELFQNSGMLALEDRGGVTLTNHLRLHSFSLEEFLQAGIHLTSILERLHKKNIIHKDLTPQNIIYNTKTGEFNIIDMSLSSSFPRESQRKRDLNLLEGTLAYISPEQTGWMNRVVDYRTDFYSLGITFYEMLTGKIPFEADDAMEMLHCHLAREPMEFPSRLNLPRVIWKIIRRLIEKNSEDRYQTSPGIIYDLEMCLDNFRHSGEVGDFKLGEKDVSDRFLIPQKIYGRNREFKVLMDAYHRASENTGELVMLTGQPGVGKTALINEFGKEVIRENGLIIGGNFEQYKRDIPYYAFIKAFDDLINLLLTENQAKKEAWRKLIVESLGVNCAVITDLVPRLELITEKQPSAVELNSIEIKNRFQWIFLKFLGLFMQANTPLVLFIDDLQWADNSSIKLIQTITTSEELKHFVFVLSYRESELSENRHLHDTLAEIKDFRLSRTGNEKALPVSIISLNEIDFRAVTDIVQDSLKNREPETEELAMAVMGKTAGNPFFINQFLKTIHSEGLIRFDNDKLRWRWDLAAIKKKGYTENVIRWMCDNLKVIPPEHLRILEVAACIGKQFDLETLSWINRKTTDETLQELMESIQHEFILAVEEEDSSKNFVFHFQHDQIRKSAYTLLDEGEKLGIHFLLAEYYIKHLDWRIRTDFGDGSGEISYVIRPESIASFAAYMMDESSFQFILELMRSEIFNIVNHLNIAGELLVSEEQKIACAGMNLIAARRSRKSAAFEAALDYLQIALAALPHEHWEKYYFLSHSIYIEAAECEYINTNFSNSRKLSRIILENAKTLLDKVKVFEIQIASLTPQNRMEEAIQSGLSALKQLGITIAPHPGTLTPFPDIVKATLKIGKNPNSLITLPEMTDGEKLAAMNIMVQLITPSFISNPALFPVLVLKLVHLTLKFGLAPQSAYAFAFFGMILGSGLGRYDLGDRLSQLALDILYKYGSGNMDCKVLFVTGNMITHWRRPLSTGQSILKDAFHKGLETGDLLFASYALNWYNAYNFLIRTPLEETLDTMQKYESIVSKIKQKDAGYFFNLWRQFVYQLYQNSHLTSSIDGIYFNEKLSVNNWNETLNNTDLFTYHLMKGIILYLRKDYDSALVELEASIPHESGVYGMPVIVEHNYFYCLVLSALGLSDEQHGNKYYRLFKKRFKKMEIWAEGNPVNYASRLHLLEGELARLSRKKDIKYFYEKAIHSSIEQKAFFDQAIANERLGEYYRARGETFVSHAYMREAYQLYLRWGALSKCLEMREEYPELVETHSQIEYLNSITERLTTSASDTLDLKTVIKVSQNISEEIELKKLIKKLMKIAIETAGAQRGYLILVHDGKLLIEAEADGNSVKLKDSLPVEKCTRIALSIVNYVNTTRESVVINDVTDLKQFRTDPYIIGEAPKSILCIPVMKQNNLIGILYIENNLLNNVFSDQRLGMINLLIGQVVISLENANYFDTIKKINLDLEDEILHRKKTEESLRLSEERYSLSARGANDGLWDWDLKKDEVYYSLRWKSLIGYEESDFGNSPNEWFSRVHHDDLPVLRSAIDNLLDGVIDHLECEYRMLHRDGGYVWMLTRGLAVTDELKHPYRMVGSQTEITRRKVAEEQLRYDALHDSLTNLPNWNLLLDRMNHAIKRKKRQKDYLFCCLFLDIDRFKLINDSLGHEIGNLLLVELARSIQVCMRPEDTIARLGGDEFGILIDGIMDIAEVIKVITQIRDRLSTPFLIGDNKLFITLSIGAVISVADYNDANEILRDADTAMHRAKSQGRNRYEIFDKTMHEHVREFLRTETELRKAIENNDFVLYYQPIVSATDGKITGVEALIRWMREGKLIDPSSFIPVAEENGLIIPIGEWVIREAVRQAKEWRDMGLSSINISVNLSAKQFEQLGLLTFLKNTLEGAGLNGEYILLELTESILMSNTDNTIQMLTHLRELGIKTCIDDFGTGYSSLNYLKQFPVSKLKIDRSFVKNMTSNSNDAAITRAIIAMGSSMNMKVVAEGVETKEQLDLLIEQSCDEIQGYYFQKPISATQFSAIAREGIIYRS
jgi:diguanylate cyclase (GGDEF)-like protein/PAS domain S-box-containing protein